MDSPQHKLKLMFQIINELHGVWVLRFWCFSTVNSNIWTALWSCAMCRGCHCLHNLILQSMDSPYQAGCWSLVLGPWWKCSLLCRQCEQLEPEPLSVWLDTQGTSLLEEQMDITLRDIALRRATSLGMLKEKKEDGEVRNSSLQL